MSSKIKIFGSSRKWLNPKGHWDTGLITWKVFGDKDYMDANLSLWDCGRKVVISFSYNPSLRSEVSQRAKKIDLMITELQKMKEALSNSYEYIINNGE